MLPRKKCDVQIENLNITNSVHIKKELNISKTMFIIIVTDTKILFIGFEEPNHGTWNEINEETECGRDVHTVLQAKPLSR